MSSNSNQEVRYVDTDELLEIRIHIYEMVLNDSEKRENLSKEALEYCEERYKIISRYFDNKKKILAKRAAEAEQNSKVEAKGESNAEKAKLVRNEKTIKDVEPDEINTKMANMKIVQNSDPNDQPDQDQMKGNRGRYSTSTNRKQKEKPLDADAAAKRKPEYEQNRRPKEDEDEETRPNIYDPNEENKYHSKIESIFELVKKKSYKLGLKSVFLEPYIYKGIRNNKILYVGKISLQVYTYQAKDPKIVNMYEPNQKYFLIDEMDVDPEKDKLILNLYDKIILQFFKKFNAKDVKKQLHLN